MGNCVLYLLFAFIFMEKIPVVTLTTVTMVRKNYSDYMLNVDGKLRKMDSKLDRLETLLNKVLQNQNTESECRNNTRHDEPTLDESNNNLLNDYTEKEILNKRFRRDFSNDTNQDTEFKDSKDISVHDLAKGIDLLKGQTENYQKNMEKKMKHLQKKTSKILKKIELLLPVLSSLKQNSETVTNHLQNVQQYSEDTAVACLNVTHLLDKSDIPESRCNRVRTRNQYTSCLDLYENGFELSKVYQIVLDEPHGNEKINVYCDMTARDGGWTVFQRRQDGSVDFYRDWNDYKTGFGNLTGEFWLGNEYLNILTDSKEPHELRIELEDFEGNHAYAEYGTFKIGPESTNYKLEVSDYTGNAGDSMEWHNGMEFSTNDMDNDPESSISCAAWYKGGWWYNRCFSSNLNGLYTNTTKCSDSAGSCILWKSFRDSGNPKILKFTEMKFR